SATPNQPGTGSHTRVLAAYDRVRLRRPAPLPRPGAGARAAVHARSASGPEPDRLGARARRDPRRRVEQRLGPVLGPGTRDVDTGATCIECAGGRTPARPRISASSCYAASV